MKLIVGLGNPGPQYARTRHNAGYMAVDALRARHAPGAVVRSRFQAECVEAPIGPERCLLLKPLTFMNLSGQTVVQAVQFYKAPLEGLLVLTDDLALPVGSVRVRAGGGAGGHNGLADIERRLGSADYPRLRIGIGPKPPMFDQAAFVLSRFSEPEEGALATAIETAADAAETFVESGIEEAMNRFNTKVRPASDDAGWGVA
jgi:peptidyl-tRNA hydrolase, PTH1 family